MKKYRLANTESRKIVDLRNCQDVIIEAVAEVMPYFVYSRKFLNSKFR